MQSKITRFFENYPKILTLDLQILKPIKFYFHSATANLRLLHSLLLQFWFDILVQCTEPQIYSC